MTLMKTMISLFRLILTGLFSLSFQPCSAQEAPASPQSQTTPVRLNVQEASLIAVLKRFSEQTKLSFLIEGEPVLKKANVFVEGSVQEALNHLADTFDYTYSISKAGMVLMQKRFQHPAEHPHIHIAESKKVTQDVLQVFQAIPFDNSDPSGGKALRHLAHSLSFGQKNALRGDNFLPIADLLPEQRRIVQEAILSRSFARSAQAWEQLALQLKHLPTSYLRALQEDTRKDKEQSPRFTYWLALKNKDGARIADYRLPYNQKGINRGTRPSVQAVTSIKTPPGNEKALSTRANLALQTTTVRQALAELSNKTGVVIKAEEYLQPRKVTILLKNIPMHAVLEALCLLHEWTWRDVGPKSYLLARPRPILPSQPTDIPQAVRALLPRDWRTYFTINAQPMEASKRTMRAASFATGLPKEIYVTEIGALLVSLLPEMQDEKPITWARLTDVQRDRLLLALVAWTIAESQEILTDTPIAYYSLNQKNTSVGIDAENNLILLEARLDNGGKLGFGVTLDETPEVPNPGVKVKLP